MDENLEMLGGELIASSTIAGLNCKVKYIDLAVPHLQQVEGGDWIDVRACSLKNKTSPILGALSGGGWEYAAGDFLLIGLGFALSPPAGFESHLAPRSSTFKNWGFIQTNSVGVIDNNYAGNDDQWFLPVYCTRAGRLEQYDRVAQFRFMPVMAQVFFSVVDNLQGPNRGGHGTTGTK